MTTQIMRMPGSLIAYARTCNPNQSVRDAPGRGKSWAGSHVGDRGRRDGAAVGGEHGGGGRRLLDLRRLDGGVEVAKAAAAGHGGLVVTRKRPRSFDAAVPSWRRPQCLPTAGNAAAPPRERSIESIERDADLTAGGWLTPSGRCRVTAADQRRRPLQSAQTSARSTGGGRGGLEATGSAVALLGARGRR